MWHFDQYYALPLEFRFRSGLVKFKVRQKHRLTIRLMISLNLGLGLYLTSTLALSAPIAAQV